MKITKRQLRRIIKEEKAKLLQEGRFKELHIMIGETVLSILEDSPGIGGIELVRLVQADYGRGEFGRVEKEEIFTVLDDLQEDDEVFFDVEEDAWYISGSQPQQDEDADMDISWMAEGTSLDNMPDTWRQILGTCLKDNT